MSSCTRLSLRPPNQDRAPARISRATWTFSRTVSEPNASSRWNVRPIPILARLSTVAPVMSTPLNRTRPLVGGCSPLMTLNSVVLPAPFGPMRPVIEPGSADSDASLTAVMPPKRTVTPVTSSKAMAGHLGLGDRLVLNRSRGRRPADQELQSARHRPPGRGEPQPAEQDVHQPVGVAAEQDRAEADDEELQPGQGRDRRLQHGQQ